MPGEPNLPSRELQTLACLLTPIGEGGISIFEVSGPEATGILDRLFISPRCFRAARMAPGRLLYGALWHKGELLDEVVLECVERTPHPVFEINCHGGAVAAQRILRALEAEGARLASWTDLLAERQRLGRFDRIAREAAEKMPFAATLLATGVLLDQYRGALSDAVGKIRDCLDAGSDWNEAEKILERLVATARFGLGLFEHARVVIGGRPNVGKSTLANALLRFERVIVHHAPGTTRDAIEEVFSIRGVPFVLVDTAGIREAGNEIEREGVRMGKEELGRADVAVLLFDGSTPLQEEDFRILGGLLPARAILVINKCDLNQVVSPQQIAEKTGQMPLVISATKNIGLEGLETRVLETAYPELPKKGEAIIFTERQERYARSGLEALRAHRKGEVLSRLDLLATEQED